MVSSKPLSFEEFCEPCNRWGYPKHNNFYLYFVVWNYSLDPYNMMSYRSKSHFKKFQHEHPELERQLTEALTEPVILEKQLIKALTEPIISEEINDETVLRETAIKRAEPQLYEAYLAMRKYVESDYDLFK